MFILLNSKYNSETCRFFPCGSYLLVRIKQVAKFLQQLYYNRKLVGPFIALFIGAIHRSFQRHNLRIKTAYQY